MTVSGSCVILLAIRKTRELHSPSFVLLCCLAFSDLIVGLICQPFFVAYVIAELVERFSAYCTLRIIHVIASWITSGVSYLTLAAVSIDRLLALTLHLRYNMIVTVPRVFITVCILVKELDYLCPISVSFNFCCYCFQHFKNISDRSKTSAPDSRPKRSRSSHQCGEHAQM